ncbi:hypothetical protein RB195_005129 [Necator americanus]|uniref:Uncharacterized protein n=1 Tax=Necator americanus TaxID=51031 RepID=A0ABR1BLB0_NECAM
MSLWYQSFIRDRTIAFFDEDFLSLGQEEKPRSPLSELRTQNYHRRGPFASLVGFWEDTVMDHIDYEYEQLVEHFHNCTRKAKSFKTTKRRLFPKTLELIRQRGVARAARNQELTSELAGLCREAIKEHLRKREKQNCWLTLQRRDRTFTTPVGTLPITTMTALRTLDGTPTALRRGIEKVIHDFYSDLFDSHVHLPPRHLMEDGHVIPKVLPFEVRHAIMSVSENRTSPALDRIKPEHLKYLTYWRRSSLVICWNARYLSNGKPARPCCCKRRETHKTSAAIVQSAYCPSSTSSLQE